ncbi:MAG TPA: methyl coenzyme M reductase system, component A2 [Candidatus Methanofastidiosa archaeon]|nr:methyl coenzyme M reductase system, component A2 [Candidatus Methanofastidiosa archaeon]
MTYSLLSVKGISKSFDGSNAIDDVSFDLYPGEILGIIGKSGSGKSVLIHAIRGSSDYKPHEGQIIYNFGFCKKCNIYVSPENIGKECSRCGGVFEHKEVDFLNLSSSELKTVKSYISIMLQRTFALYGELTVYENVLKELDNIGYNENGKIKRVSDLLTMVKMEHRMLHIAKDLSGGEKQRIVLARQLAMEPLILLADEPTGTLDPKTSHIVLQVLKDVSVKTGMPMIITSHNPRVVSEIADKVIWMEDGKVKGIGKPSEIVNSFLEEMPEMREESFVCKEEPKVIVKNVKKYFYSIMRGLVKAVDGVDFEIKENEIFGLLGTSGAGKTTLSRMIGGVTEPTEGEISVRVGDEWIDMTKPGFLERGRAKQDIGLLHQEYSLYPSRSIFENLTDAIGMSLPKELAKIKAIQVLTSIGFAEDKAKTILEKYPNELSVGERHRIALSQVLIREPSLVILDEPSGTMDPITRTKVAMAIKEARKNLDETFIIVTHNMDFACEVCDKVSLMENGKIVCSGTAREVTMSMKDGVQSSDKVLV